MPLAPVLPPTPPRADAATDGVTANDATANRAADDARLRALGIDGPYLLSAATLEPRKNLVRLVQAYAAAASRARGEWPRLVIAGRLGWKWREILEASAQTSGVHVTGYVDDETLASLYRRAVAFAYPSLDEGFGLPVLEAMACGCPVLTSHVPVLREVAGGAADLTDPLDVDSIAAGLEALVADESRRASLVRRGLARAAQFSWARTAAGVEAGTRLRDVTAASDDSRTFDMATPRVLTLCNWFPPRYVGGAEVSAFYTVHGLKQRGYDVRVLSIWARGTESSESMHEFRGIPVHEVLLARDGGGPAPELFDRRVYQHVLDEINEFKPDLVHMHNISGASLAPFAACRQAGVRVVQTLHDYWLLCAANMLYQTDGALCHSTSQWSCCGRCYRHYDHWADVPFRRKLFSIASSSVRRFITPSGALRDLHVRSGYDPARFSVVPYGITPDVQIATTDAPDRAATSARLRQLIADRSDNVVLFCGVLVETKGLDTLVDAAPLMQQYAGPLQLWIAGGGEGRYVEKLQSLTSPASRCSAS